LRGALLESTRRCSRTGESVGHYGRAYHWHVSAMDVADWLRKLGLEQYEPAYRAN